MRESLSFSYYNDTVCCNSASMGVWFQSSARSARLQTTLVCRCHASRAGKVRRDAHGSIFSVDEPRSGVAHEKHILTPPTRRCISFPESGRGRTFTGKKKAGQLRRIDSLDESLESLESKFGPTAQPLHLAFPT
jgi:hypothetical protein